MLRLNNLLLHSFVLIYLLSSNIVKSDLAFITNQESNKVDVVDLKLKKKINEIEVGEKPAGIFIDNKNKLIFISNPESHSISKFRYNDKNIEFFDAGKSPMSLFYVESTNFLYITNWYENKITIVDTSTNLIIKELKVGRSPAGIFISEIEKKIFVANRDDNNISIFNLDTLNKIKDIKVGNSPYGIFSEPETQYVFITNVQSNSISLINKKSLVVEEEIKVGNWPYQVALNTTNNFIYVTNQRDNSLSVIDLNKKIVVNTLKDVCEYPEGIDISYNENLIVVACWFEDNIILLDLDSNRLIKRIEMSGGPRAFGKFILK